MLLCNLIVLFLALALTVVPVEADPTHPYAATDLFTPNIIAISLAVLGFVVGGAVGNARGE